MSACGPRYSTTFFATIRSFSATAANASCITCRPLPRRLQTAFLSRLNEALRSLRSINVVSTAPDAIVAYIDGGARGNPGPAGYGVRIERPDGMLVEEFCEAIGVATNNVAEYRGLIAALEWAKQQGYRQGHVTSDSLLPAQQMLGRLKAEAPVT